MKIKSGFAKRKIADSHIVVPIGNKINDFNGMITLNESGAFFWDCLCEDITLDDLIKKVLDEYDIDEKTAKKDVENFINMLKENDLLED